MEVNQSVTAVDQHISDILVDQLVANFFGFTESHEADLVLGVLREVLKFDLAHELGEVLILSERLLYLLFLEEQEFNWDRAGLVRVRVVGESNWDIDCEDVF